MTRLDPAATSFFDGPPILKPTTKTPQLRWMVRREHVRPTRFGDTRAGIAWAVTPYVARTPDGHLIGGFIPTYFATRNAALAYAHRQQRMTYRKGTR